MTFPVSRRIINLYKWESLDVLRLFLKAKLIKGEYEDLFLRDFSKYVGCEYAVAASTGRMALCAILESLDLPVGSQVIVPAYEDLSVPETIKELGLIPVFSDINYATQNIELRQFEHKVTAKTSAIIVAHLFGNPCGMEEIISFAKKKNLKVIEDCAHALGSRIGQKHVGNFGDAGFFSFHTTKPFMCFGGGMVITNNEKLWKKAQGFICELSYPAPRDIVKRVIWAYVLNFVSSGIVFTLLTYPFLLAIDLLKIDPICLYNRHFRGKLNIKKKETRFTNLQSLIGLKNLDIIGKNLEKRKRNAEALDRLLSKTINKVKFTEGVNYYYYIILSDKMEYIRKIMLRRGIDTGRAVMRNCPSILGAEEGFPNTTSIFAASIQIPIHEKVSLRHIVKISQILSKIYPDE